jgi:hypothetical protein
MVDDESIDEFPIDILNKILDWRIDERKGKDVYMIKL